MATFTSADLAAKPPQQCPDCGKNRVNCECDEQK